jgi:hypothetical protein
MAANIFNWVGDAIHQSRTAEAKGRLEKIKSAKYGHGKKFMMVKTKDHPPTWKEVEVK